jgi:hypothetical protein
MTPETPTPETDADYKEAQDFERSALVEPLEKFLKVERERDAARAEIAAMREAIKETASHLSGFLGFHSECLSLEQVRALSATLDKLRPFLADQKAQARLDGGPGLA